jgi:predicted transcriptional regulator
MRDEIARIVSAYVRGNAVAPAELPALISQVGAFLFGLSKPFPPVVPGPAVPVERSVLPDAVICLDCGWQGKVLRGHVSVAHGLSPGAYRERWGLTAHHPLVAPSYSRRRSALAASSGFRRRGTDPKLAAPTASKERARRGRPRKSRLGSVE